MNRLSRIAKGIQAVLPRRVEDIEEAPVTSFGFNSVSSFETPSGRKFRVSMVVNTMTPDYIHEVDSLAPKLWDFVDREFPNEEIDYLGVIFSDEEGDQHVTGKGEEQHVFGGVIRAANSLMQQHSDVPLVLFSGKRDEGVRQGRTSIYERLARNLGGDLGYAKIDTGAYDKYMVPNPHYKSRVTASRKAVLRKEDIEEAKKSTPEVHQETEVTGDSRYDFTTPSGRIFTVSFSVLEDTFDSLSSGGTDPNLVESLSAVSDPETGIILVGSVVFVDDRGQTSISGLGRGEVHPILNSVAAIVDKWIRVNPQVGVVYFTGGGSRGRVAIYKRLTKMINPEANYIEGSKEDASFFAINPHYNPSGIDALEDNRSAEEERKIERLKQRFAWLVRENEPVKQEIEKEYFTESYAEQTQYFADKLRSEGKTDQEIGQQVPPLAYEAARDAVRVFGQEYWDKWVYEVMDLDLIEYMDEVYFNMAKADYTSLYDDFYHAVPRGASRKESRCF